MRSELLSPRVLGWIVGSASIVVPLVAVAWTLHTSDAVQPATPLPVPEASPSEPRPSPPRPFTVLAEARSRCFVEGGCRDLQDGFETLVIGKPQGFGDAAGSSGMVVEADIRLQGTIQSTDVSCRRRETRFGVIITCHHEELSDVDEQHARYIQYLLDVYGPTSSAIEQSYGRQTHRWQSGKYGLEVTFQPGVPDLRTHYNGPLRLAPTLE